MNNKVQANKKLGQHFLTNQNIISSICSDFEDEADAIIEVGPGPGILTEKLSQISKPFFVVEKDTRFKENLEQVVGEDKVFIKDALTFSWQRLFKYFQLNDSKIWLVSNLPYNVGTVLFTQFLSVPQIKYMTLMFQKEVGEKTIVRNIKNEMNGLLFLSQNYFQSKKLVKVSPGSFSPPPKVDSIVISYTRREHPDVAIDDFETLNSFLRVLFAMKRKQIQKVLKAKYPEDKITEGLKHASIEASLRAESLTYQQVLDLFQHLELNR
ncbi:MAG: ribosomal RNA small subunit methyltransferase A [Halobacteriovoraceae bacterium]|nr:ribosomal RNA small subunit methyltransferase A [Halobacteriovoraceae bacterium]|tara:strand:- start:34549 stop:35349 length:801 start_codon:yes stop_codon:yes gene_type:complete